MIQYKDKMLVVQKFNLQDIGLEGVRTSRKKLSNNINKYIEWILVLLKNLIPSDKKYSIIGVYMNEKNCNILNKHLNPWDWMNYSPVTCNLLQDDEIGIDLSKVFDVP